MYTVCGVVDIVAMFTLGRLNVLSKYVIIISNMIVTE